MKLAESLNRLGTETAFSVLAKAKKLISEADVLINNFRPGVMDSLGLGKEDCKTLNKDLIYVAITGFGKQGPYANAPAYDHVVQAMSGSTAIQADEDKPKYIKTFHIVVIVYQLNCHQ